MQLAIHVITQQVLIPVILWCSLAFSILGIAVGAGLVLNAALMQRISAVMNRWVSMRKSTKWLSMPRDIGQVVQRYRLPIGVVFVLVATFSLYGLLTRVDVGNLALALKLNAPLAAVVWILKSIYWFLIVGDVLAIVTGIMLVVSPGALHKIESHANRWHSFRRVSVGGDAMHTGIDRGVARFPRAAGLAIAVAALGVMISSIMLLRALG